jgi:hypothetical protein
LEVERLTSLAGGETEKERLRNKQGQTDRQTQTYRSIVIRSCERGRGLVAGSDSSVIGGREADLSGRRGDRKREIEK